MFFGEDVVLLRGYPRVKKKTQKKHKGNGKPKDGDRKDGKEQQEEREFGTKDTQGKYRACVRRRTQRRDK